MFKVWMILFISSVTPVILNSGHGNASSVGNSNLSSIGIAYDSQIEDRLGITSTNTRFFLPLAANRNVCEFQIFNRSAHEILYFRIFKFGRTTPVRPRGERSVTLEQNCPQRIWYDFKPYNSGFDRRQLFIEDGADYTFIVNRRGRFNLVALPDIVSNN